MAAPLEVALALIAVGVMYSLLLWARRVHAVHRERAYAEARERLEPLAHALLDGEPSGTTARRDEQALTQILADLAPALTGESRDAIADHFESSGAVARTSRRLADPRAHRRAEHAALLGDMCSSLAEVPLTAGAERPRPGCAPRRRAQPRPPAPAHRRGPPPLRPRPGARAAGRRGKRAALDRRRRAAGHPPPAPRRPARRPRQRRRAARPARQPARQRVAARCASATTRRSSAAAPARRSPGWAQTTPATPSRSCSPTTSPMSASRPPRPLGAVGDERSAPTLLRLVQHDCVEVAEVAARALASVAPALVEHLGSDPAAHPQLRHAASLLEAGVA